MYRKTKKKIKLFFIIISYKYKANYIRKEINFKNFNLTQNENTYFDENLILKKFKNTEHKPVKLLEALTEPCFMCLNDKKSQIFLSCCCLKPLCITCNMKWNKHCGHCRGEKQKVTGLYDIVSEEWHVFNRIDDLITKSKKNKILIVSMDDKQRLLIDDLIMNRLKQKKNGVYLWSNVTMSDMVVGFNQFKQDPNIKMFYSVKHITAFDLTFVDCVVLLSKMHEPSNRPWFIIKNDIISRIKEGTDILHYVSQDF